MAQAVELFDYKNKCILHSRFHREWITAYIKQTGKDEKSYA